jgi:hypothetical protein
MAEETTNQGNIKQEFNTANTGLNLDLTVNQIPKGALTYALNASVENFDASSINYQNEPGNELCLNFPEGYQLIGEHSIYEKNKHIFFLANPHTGGSEIGYMDNNDCVYHTLVNAVCLNFNIDYPIHKAVHKITNCTTEIYWTDGFNPRRYLDIENVPYIQSSISQPCDERFTTELDCNAIKLQPNFAIPQLKIVGVNNGGNLIAGTYQFAVQYSDATGNGYSSYYSVTNPTPIADTQITTLNFNYPVGRSIDIQISNLETKGQWQYFNLAVIKTINAITSVELVGTYFIDEVTKQITYSGQNQELIRLTVDDIFEKFPYYEIAQDLTAVRDILVWDQLTSIDQVNYQQIANQITLQWQTYKIPANENYADELNATNLRGYLRDEVYPFEIVFLLKNGKQTDAFHIPGRVANANDLALVYPTNADFIGTPDPITGGSPTWKIYNTASVIGAAVGDNINNATPYQYGEFAYWESSETYPCNTLVWGDLANKPIRHHKFPDVLVSPIIESSIISSPNDMVMQNDSVFPIGVKVDLFQIKSLINSSNLSAEEKTNIEGFKIVRGDRGTNKSIVAKGILRNVGKYDREGTEYYYPNYPYNDLRPDPFLLKENNAFTTSSDEDSNRDCRNFTVKVLSLPNDCDPFVIEFTDCFTNTTTTKQSTTVGEEITFCSTDLYPRIIAGEGCLKSNTYKVYRFVNGGDLINCYEDGNTILSYNPPFNLILNPDLFNLDLPNFLPCPDACCDACNPPRPDNIICSSPQFGSPITQTFAYPRCTEIFYSMTPPVFVSGSTFYTIEEVESYGQDLCFPTPLDSFVEEDLKYRQIFNSPETAFGQPFLGNVLKLESVIYGAGSAHFVQVQKNAQYKLISKEAQQDAINSANGIANITAPDYNASAFFAAYQAYLTIYINGITRRNYGWSFNSIAGYDYSNYIDNEAIGTDGFLGIKQREIDIAQYLIPGVQNVGDDRNINNFQRESSVYIKTTSEDKTLLRSYITYRICNTNVVANTQTFRYTDIATGLPTITSNITQGNCLNINSYTYPTQVSGNTIFTITEIGVAEQPVIGPTPPLLFPDDTPSVSSGGIPFIVDNSRFTLSSGVPTCNTRDVIADCNNPGQETKINVISYYASIKNVFPNQWGQIYSYDVIDTGFQRDITPLTSPVSDTVFGGDTFISRFTFKTKLPFFIDNTVQSPDDRDIFFDEIGNVAYPKYWFSARSVLSNSSAGGVNLTNFVSIKAHNLDCPNSQGGPTDTTIAGRTFYDGKMYLFAYGIPSFYCESSYNLDLRQAFNNKEGDFWPHVSTGIPDDWVQEANVSIAQDNTYYYNVTFSKQNKENFFSHLPVDYTIDLCATNFPFRAIYSEAQTADADNTVNSWLIYRAVSKFDFPQNYGKLVSLDGIQNKATLARFENKSLLYGTLLTINTSNPQAAYIGNPSLFASSPPVDFAETDLGYVGSQNKMLLKIPNGQVTVDAKRGQVFLIQGTQVKDLSGFGSGMNKFFTNNLSFDILRYFPNADTDNHFTGIGLHGVYDSKYDRVILTKLDYTPINPNVKYDDVTKTYYIVKTPITGEEIREEVYLTDQNYFCNKSWTVSYSTNTGTWTSFHTYLPNYYIAENNFFYSGLNDCCSTIEAVVAEVLPEPTTTSTSSTTTTSTSSTSTTSTTTTRFAGCDLEGIAEVYDCDLFGVAVDITPTTTTTTTAGPTTTTTTTTIAYDYYLADRYTCDGCTVDVVSTGVCFPAGTSVTIGKFYDSSSYYGLYTYQITALNPGGTGMDVILESPEYDSCLLGCAVEPPPTTTTTTTPTPPDISCFTLTYLGPYASLTTCLGEELEIIGGYYRIAYTGGPYVTTDVNVYYDITNVDGCTSETTYTDSYKTITAFTSYVDFVFIFSTPQDCPPDSPCRSFTSSIGGIIGSSVPCAELTTTTTTTTTISCNEYILSEGSYDFLDCLGEGQIVVVPEGDSTNVCASTFPGGGATLIGPCIS